MNKLLVTMCIVSAIGVAAFADTDLVINAFDRQGLLTWSYPTNDVHHYRVEWASSISGPWTSSWQTLTGIAPTGNTMTASVPMFYRVVAVPDSFLYAGMSSIPAGPFLMGNSDGGNSSPAHTVFVSSFYMDKYEVTKQLWDEVYYWAVTNGYVFGIGSSFKPGGPLGPQDADLPVYNLKWYDAVKWCNARSEMNGLSPFYYTDSSLETVYRSGDLDITNDCVDWAATGFRLPTEAEWEKAARGGNAGWLYPWGNEIDSTKANYASNLGSSTNVGSYQPNDYGLYDMAGNVYEWVWDSYDGKWYEKPGATEDDTRGPDTATTSRIARGGSFVSSDCRVDMRPFIAAFETTTAPRVGFRTGRQ